MEEDGAKILKKIVKQDAPEQFFVPERDESSASRKSETRSS